jgi:Tfp pilus assembly protein PilN
MIRINLLPRELQQASRTPMKLFVTFLVGVVVCMLLLCTYAYLWFNIVVLKERSERKHEEVAQLNKTAEEVDGLLDDIADYRERERAIISIKTNRMLWSRKMDELCRITPNYIWIVRLDMRELDPIEYKWEPGQLQTGGYLKLKCYSSGDEVDRMTAYRQKLKSVDEFYLKFMQESIKPENFYSDFINITPPEWRFVLLKGYRNPSNIRFMVRLDLRPLAEQKIEGKA